MPTEPVEQTNDAATENRERVANRRKLLKAGLAAVPVMVTVRSASAQATGLTRVDFTDSIGRAAGSQLSKFFDGLDKDTGGVRQPDVINGTDAFNSIGCMNEVDSHFTGLTWESATSEMYQATGTSRPSLEDFQEQFRGVRFDQFNPENRYHSTYLHIVLSSACVASISTGANMARPFEWDNGSGRFV